MLAIKPITKNEVTNNILFIKYQKSDGLYVFNFGLFLK